MPGQLSYYLNDTANLLRDQNFLWTSKSQMIRWINESRRQVAQRTGCILRLLSGASAFGASAQPGQMVPGGIQPGALPGAFPNAQLLQTTNAFQAITGVERYPYQGFANPVLQQQHAGCATIIDVASLSISWAGSFRPSINWFPWEDLQAYARVYSTQITSYPCYWSVMNDGENGEVWLFPEPTQPLEMEWYVYATPSELYTDDDYDAIPAGWRNAIKFGAAELAFMSSQRYAQAQVMGSMFTQRVGSGRFAADHGKVPNFYASVI
jgi:hypothetical protein